MTLEKKKAERKDNMNGKYLHTYSKCHFNSIKDVYLDKLINSTFVLENDDRSIYRIIS